mgnify:CR=1 FL=1
MFKEFIKNEFKNWLRDPMMRFMLFYPILFGIIGRYILPMVAENSGFSIDMFADFILVFLTLMIPVIYGAVIGFSILDDRDDNVLKSVKVTPLSIDQFLSFRMIIAVVLTVIACIYVIWFSNIAEISFLNMVLISILAALAAPVSGLFINAFASNKVEGFAIMKGSGAILIFPLVALYFTDYKEFFFSFAPGFWPAKAISTLIRGEEILPLNFWLYYLIGLIYVIILNVFMYRFFLKRTMSD